MEMGREQKPMRSPDISYFYKYRSLAGTSREWTLATLTERSLYFANPKTFNDPFDCRPIYSMDCSDEEFLKYAKFVLDTKGAGLSPDQRSEIESKFKEPGMRDKLLESMAESHEARVLDAVGVCSVSETFENVLMWSHYADEHRGLCFQFNASRYRPFFGRAQKVLYRTEMPVLNRIKKSNLENLEAALLTKAADWAYEREWRIIDHEQNAGVRQFPAEDLCGVILGYRISEENAAEVREAVRKIHPTVVVYKAMPHPSEFKIQITTAA